MTQSPSRSMPTPAEFHVWRDHIKAIAALRTQLERRLLDGPGVSSADYDVMLALWDAPVHRLRSSALADAMGWERSRVSHHLKRMQAKGLVDREMCADDQRGSDVVLTVEGERAFRRASVAHLRDIRELVIDAFSPEQLELLASITQTLRTHLDAEGGTHS